MSEPLAARLARLTPAQREQLLRARGGAAPAKASGGLSPAQQRMWFLEQLSPGSTAYFVYDHRILRGPLDAAKLERAFIEVIARHETLRTTFHDRDGMPEARVHESMPFTLERATGDWRAVLDAEASRGFDLARGPLIRATLVPIADDEHLLLVTMHHIISDGWSLEVLDRDLRAFYAGESLPPLAPPLPRDDERHIAWWKETLAGAPDVLELPTDRPRPAVQSFRGGRVTTKLSQEILDGINALAQRERVTLFMVVLAAFETLLHRYTGQDELVIGTPVANRTPDTEALIALYVNTIAIRASLAGDPTFRELLVRVRDRALDAFAHQDAPFDRVVDALGLERNASRTPLFQTMLVLGAGRGGSEPLGDVEQERIHPATTVARFDLTLSMGVDDDGIVCLFDYAADLFDEPTIATLARHFEDVLRAAIAAPETNVSRIPLGVRAHGATLHGLFTAQAARTPDAPAVITPDRTVTYAELDAMSDAIARELPPAQFVAFHADRSIDAIAKLLGILKSGAAYLPVDPSTPPDRRAWMLADANAYDLESRNGSFAPRSDSSAAYLIYTSGSTGTPKGVVVEHRSAVNLALAFARSHAFAGHRVLMLPPLAFDASVGDVFPAFATGAALVLHPSPSDLDARELARFCNEHGVTAIDAPAALWRRWLDAWTPIPQLTLMMVGGESVPAADVRRFARLTANRVRFFNHYGPTEATVCATVYETVDAGEVAFTEIPIGRPLPNVTVYILDAQRQPVPRGVAGELYIGGIAVARGYHANDDLTAAKFVDDPFTPGGRMYRTGDLARELPSGDLQFLGRIDRQLKLRGYRIEPGEIEAALLAQDGVRAAVVTLRDARLVAYVVGNASLEPLRNTLPSYMVPALVTLDALPLTANGKVDFHALPEPPRETDDARPFTAPRNETEERLAAIWSRILGRERIGIHDDFFALGGDSLRTMPLIHEVRAAFKNDLPLSSVFTAPTIARFAELLTTKRETIALASRVAPRIELRATERAAFPPRDILLTGATGFLGAFLLDELLRESGARVHCLVRAIDVADAKRRIAENLAAYGLAADLDRIVPILGDLSLPALGVDARELARSVDLIVHNGGAVNFLAPYETLEAANVAGTRAVLELAATDRIKPVHFVSTLGVHLAKGRAGSTISERDALPDGESIVGGYNQSKWVADRIAADARAAGLPVSIHRPARITGASDTGALNAGDFFFTWLRGCVQLGVFPDENAPFAMSPVDLVARAIVRIVLRGGEPADYHYFNRHTMTLSDLVNTLTNCGVVAGVLPYRAWRDLLAARIDGNALAKFAAILPPDLEDDEPRFDTTFTDEALASLGIDIPSTQQLFETCLARLEFASAVGEVR